MYEDPRDDIDMILELSVGRVKVFVSLQLVVNLLVGVLLCSAHDELIEWLHYMLIFLFRCF